MFIEINRNLEASITRQVYEQLRTAILKGELKAGEKMTSTREFASQCHISRNVVLEAYQLLEIEGFIKTFPKSGTFVAEGAIFSDIEGIDKIKEPEITLENNSVIDLRSGNPDLSIFPKNKWIKAYREVMLDFPDSYLGYGGYKGVKELREEISEYLLRVRGLKCSAQQIIITNGSMHSFSLLGRVLLNENKEYVLEEPFHKEIKPVFTSIVPAFKTVSVDENGIRTNYLMEEWNPSFIVVTPSHQYPMGGCLPIQRRIELIKYAQRKNCYIIEDDYDSEFRYAGSPVSTLYNLAQKEVIYLGSFSKIFFPNVRLGYMIVPPELLEKVWWQLRNSNYFIDTITQLAMARMLKERILERHIHKMKKAYHKKQQTMIKSLRKHFNNSVKIIGDSTGLHMIGDFEGKIFGQNEIAYYLKKGIKIHPVWQHTEDKNYSQSQIILGYSHLTENEIEKAIAILST